MTHVSLEAFAPVAFALAARYTSSTDLAPAVVPIEDISKPRRRMSPRDRIDRLRSERGWLTLWPRYLR